MVRKELFLWIPIIILCILIGLGPFSSVIISNQLLNDNNQTPTIMDKNTRYLIGFIGGTGLAWGASVISNLRSRNHVTAPAVLAFLIGSCSGVFGSILLINKSLSPYYLVSFNLWLIRNISVVTYMALLSNSFTIPRILGFFSSLSITSFITESMIYSIYYIIISTFGLSPSVYFIPSASITSFSLSLLLSRFSVIKKDSLTLHHFSVDQNPNSKTYSKLTKLSFGYQKRIERSPYSTLNTEDKTLKIYQITDPHIGPLITASSIRKMCERAVIENPDLILLTGDYFTVESERSDHCLEEAFKPLESFKGKVFACLGNHDIESQKAFNSVKRQLANLGIELLVDEQRLVQTRIGLVQIVGVNYYTKPNRHLVNKVCLKYPPQPQVPRIILLHDPHGAGFVPSDDRALIFSGHTHGGHIGLTAFGIELTVVRPFGADHGLWGTGSNLIYVHRGQGFRFLLSNSLLRIGVPPENSLCTVTWKS